MITKNIIYKTGLLLLIPLCIAAQKSTEKISREFTFEKKGSQNTLMIFNINGGVKVEGYSGDKILVEIEKTIEAKTDARLATRKEELQLGVLDRADTIMLYLKGVCGDFGKSDKNGWKMGNSRWGYSWNDCNRRNGDCDKGDDYKMNFTIKIPRSVHLFISTVNQGDIEVTNTTGTLAAHNVNGSIKLTNISGSTIAKTINGQMDLDYSANPSGNSTYYALNGNINANFVKGLAAQLTFKSFNGDLFSSIENITPLSVAVEKYEKGEGIHYKVNGNRYRIGNGGPLLDFETFNGDVFLKERSN